MRRWRPCRGARTRDQSRRRRASIVRRSTIDPVPCRRDAAPFPSSLGTRMKPAAAKTAWALLALIGAFCLGTVALRRGESINALWIVVAATSIYLVAYRFYSRYIPVLLFSLDAARLPPAVVDYD